MTDVARGYIQAPVDYEFTERERMALAPFFSNHDKRVFFFKGLPANVAASLLAMYSRLKNPRGIRGHFVDHLVPLLMLAEVFSRKSVEETGTWKQIQASYRKRGLDTLDKICAYDDVLEAGFHKFLQYAANPDFWSSISSSDRIRDFLEMWLDKFGHNSIARPGQVIFAAEGVSILAAKSLEWGRPGSGFIELSTRFVDFTGKRAYPIGRELSILDPDAAMVAESNIGYGVDWYQTLMGTRTDGPFPSYLRERWGSVVGSEKNLEAGVFGESCDVLGNLLPCATLTSLGVSVSGEALPGLLKHLVLDDTPENDALAELIGQEAKKIGADQFIRHLDISEWRRADWSYLRAEERGPRSDILPNPIARDVLLNAFTATEGHERYEGWMELVLALSGLERSEFDKLPAQFEHISASFASSMSFRGWRDLQRQGFCTHHRSLVTPNIGFYGYPKPHPPALRGAFDTAWLRDRNAWEKMEQVGIPPTLRQYAMSMGELVNYTVAANLRQWEFCDWQRTKWVVNDEVRQQFLRIENALRQEYPWWEWLSRANMTEHFIFARGSKPTALVDDE
jgi:hypothetical protein